LSNFLTEGRLALLAALQGDDRLAALVRTWFDYGPGLLRRRRLDPALCPVLALAPAEGASRQATNAHREVPQVLNLELATAGQDVEPCEELCARVLACVDACNEANLGLADEGLTALHVSSMRWAYTPDSEAQSMTWSVAIEVELLWRRGQLA
jgi:hypothetical protein